MGKAVPKLTAERAKALVKKGDLLRSRQVAYVLDLSPDDAIELARKGKLPAFKVGRFWFYKKTEVDKYKKRMARATA